MTITPEVRGGHGSISPSLPQSLAAGATPTFALVPDAGYRLSRLSVDGKALVTLQEYAYTFLPLTADHGSRQGSRGGDAHRERPPSPLS